MIFRREVRNAQFTTVDNEFIRDINISFKAKGILLYMLSRPDNWTFYESEIAENTAEGIKSIKSGIKELINFGYVERHQLKKDNKFNGYEYIIHEKSPKCRFRTTGNRTTQNGAIVNTDITKDLHNKNNDNGANPNGICSCAPFLNDEFTDAMKVYMSDLYKQKTGKPHPSLKKAQFIKVHDAIKDFADEKGLDRDGIVDLMCSFINNKAIISDYNINHFATEGIMMNRFYEEAY